MGSLHREREELDLFMTEIEHAEHVENREKSNKGNSTASTSSCSTLPAFKAQEMKNYAGLEEANLFISYVAAFFSRVYKDV